ncbi:hypothetical protein ZIOFF_053928 [Zingiber officinale]|uniref:Legume lectin domain-containing protein n=2 Tax=Zingiber officinale TaxID=94328 RepID=A0A8J5KM66_ZINOF|nr:hypothetical protein ZIOFF_053928 [Zingiber officinale]
MATSSASAFALAVLLLPLVIASSSVADQNKGKPFFFSYVGSDKNRTLGSEFALYGDAELSDSAVRLTRPAKASTGRVAYREPVRFFGTSPGFSSSFSFALSPGHGGGLAFFLSPSGVQLEPVNGHWSRVSTSLVAVRFETAKADKITNLTETLIEIDVESSNLSGNNLVLDLDNGRKFKSWIDYDGESKRIEVRLSLEKESKPINFSISYSMDLSYLLWREAALVVLSSWSSHSSQGSSIYSWNFTQKHGAPFLMHSEPLDPNSFLARSNESAPVHPIRSYPWEALIAMVFAAACGAMLAFFTVFVWSALRSRRPVAPVDCPVPTVGIACEKMESVGVKILENDK